MAKYCEFNDEDFEIKLQIVCCGKLSRLRKKALRADNFSLTDMLIEGRKSESSSAQATGIEQMTQNEQNQNVNKIAPEKNKCFKCGFSYPHTSRPCPAKDSTFNICGNKGHFVRVCRSKNTTQQKPQKKPQRNRENMRQKKAAKAIAVSESTECWSKIPEYTRLSRVWHSQIQKGR